MFRGNIGRYLETDTSGSGIGAVLSQNWHPISYFSKILCSRMQKQSTYLRELFAIIKALAKFCHYMIGHKFIIKKNQCSLKPLMDQAIQSPEQQHWLHKFLGYDFTIEYKPKVDNVAAYSLSRSFCLEFSVQTPQFISMIHSAVNEDQSLSKFGINAY